MKAPSRPNRRPRQAGRSRACDNARSRCGRVDTVRTRAGGRSPVDRLTGPFGEPFYGGNRASLVRPCRTKMLLNDTPRNALTSASISRLRLSNILAWRGYRAVRARRRRSLRGGARRLPSPAACARDFSADGARSSVLRWSDEATGQGVRRRSLRQFDKPPEAPWRASLRGRPRRTLDPKTLISK